MWFFEQNSVFKNYGLFLNGCFSTQEVGRDLKFLHDLDEGLKGIENDCQVSSWFTGYFSPKLKQGVRKTKKFIVGLK